MATPVARVARPEHFAPILHDDEVAIILDLEPHSATARTQRGRGIDGLALVERVVERRRVIGRHRRVDAHDCLRRI